MHITINRAELLAAVKRASTIAPPDSPLDVLKGVLLEADSADGTVWPCHRALATPEVCTEIDRVYDALIALDALKDLAALRKFCADHMDACISKEYEDEFSFYYVGERCNFWIRLITRKGDYNMYLNAYAKESGNQKYFDYLERLRQSGETNMYGAAPYLQSEFPELRDNRSRAGDILLAWIRTFNEKEDDTPC